MKLWDILMVGIIIVSAWLAGSQMLRAQSAPDIDLSGLSRSEAETLARRVAEVNVITSNCAGYAISDADWLLLSGASDALAAKLGMDAGEYERRVYGPAFQLLDQSGSCERIGPTAGALISKLSQMTR